MNQNAFNELKRQVAAKPNQADFGTPATEETIRKAEEFLGVRFPTSYIEFLKTWGTLAIGPCEFYGITGSQFENGKIPNGIWFTGIKRKQIDLPKNLIIISDNGDEYICLEASTGRVVRWGFSTKATRAANPSDLFEFILDQAKDWL